MSVQSDASALRCSPFARQRSFGLQTLICAAAAALLVNPVRAGVLEEARALQRQLYYEDASNLLKSELDNLVDEERAKGLFMLAELSSDHKEARRLLREAYRASDSQETRRAADLALARLDYARGNYNSVRTRLRNYENDESAALLVAKAFVALGDAGATLRTLRQAGSREQAQLLRGWSEREAGNVQEAQAILELLLRREGLNSRPTALLWKAECEATLELQEEALETAAELQEAFPDSPEAILVQSTLATLRRPSTTPEDRETQARGVLLQIGAFEDRANALRFRDSLPRHIGPVSVDEVREGVRRLYRVHIGAFDTLEIAEAYGREHLDPIDIEWQLSEPGSP